MINSFIYESYAHLHQSRLAHVLSDHTTVVRVGARRKKSKNIARLILLFRPFSKSAGVVFNCNTFGAMCFVSVTVEEMQISRGPSAQRVYGMLSTHGSSEWYRTNVMAPSLGAIIYIPMSCPTNQKRLTDSVPSFPSLSQACLNATPTAVSFMGS
jgi:hypothetical protein